ncbi:MAG: cobalamin-dependent protein [Deltaproteobacteria bacterium]|nr:cobalamin-dependent protein [Deltaproteobacteria bacterium]
MAQRIHLVMVGYERPGSENMSLRLLAGAARDAGHSVSVCTATSLTTAEAAVQRAVETKAAVMGIVLQDSHSFVHSLALASLAHQKGYSGYIVCAGEFAALQSDFVLERAPYVDGVIRFDGTHAIVALLNALANGDSLEKVPSLYTRSFSTPNVSAPVLTGWRPKRGKTPSVMGVKTSEVVASRGCSFSCEYCTHAATDAHAGYPHRQHRRNLNDLADEMAALYHEQEVRHFGFSDANVVPAEEGAALDWAGQFKAALIKRGATNVSLSFMTRADGLTEKVVAALADLGLCRTLEGVESCEQYGLDALGRAGSAVRGHEGVRRLVDNNIVTLFNDIILHPESTPESIQVELNFLKQSRGALFNTIEATPYWGTRFWDRLVGEGRITGGRILPTFKLRDPVVTQFQRMVARLHTEVFNPYNPTLRAHDLMFSVALARRHRSVGGEVAELEETLGRIAVDLNRVRVAVLQHMLETAIHSGGIADVIESARIAFSPITKALDETVIRLRCLTAMDVSGNVVDVSVRDDRQLSKTYFNFVAAATLAFAMAGTSGCHHAGQVDADTADTQMDSSADTDTQTDTATETVYSLDTSTSVRLGDTSTEQIGLDTETESGSVDPHPADTESTIVTSDTDTDNDTGTDGSCDSAKKDSQLSMLRDEMINACEADTVVDTLWITLDEDGLVLEVSGTGTHDLDSEPMSGLIACTEKILKGEQFPCLAGEAIWVSIPPIKVIE